MLARVDDALRQTMVRRATAASGEA